MCHNISKTIIFELHKPVSCVNIGLEVNTMSTAIAYDNSLQCLKAKKKGIVESIKDVIATHKHYDGLFSASQAQGVLEISKQRFFQIEERLEKIRVPMMGNKEFYTGRGLIAYRGEAVENVK